MPNVTHFVKTTESDVLEQMDRCINVIIVCDSKSGHKFVKKFYEIDQNMPIQDDHGCGPAIKPFENVTGVFVLSENEQKYDEDFNEWA